MSTSHSTERFIPIALVRSISVFIIPVPGLRSVYRQIKSPGTVLHRKHWTTDRQGPALGIHWGTPGGTFQQAESLDVQLEWYCELQQGILAGHWSQLHPESPLDVPEPLAWSSQGYLGRNWCPDVIDGSWGMRESWRDTARRRPVLWRAGSGGRGDVQAGPTETVPRRRSYYWGKPFLEQVNSTLQFTE